MTEVDSIIRSITMNHEVARQLREGEELRLAHFDKALFDEKTGLKYATENYIDALTQTTQREMFGSLTEEQRLKFAECKALIDILPKSVTPECKEILRIFWEGRAK